MWRGGRWESWLVGDRRGVDAVEVDDVTCEIGTGRSAGRGRRVIAGAFAVQDIDGIAARAVVADDG